MVTKKIKFMNPNDFYKSIRPEYFSDSEIIFETELSREVLAHELNYISTNQKQDQFERLARLLCEKYITPNLIPQVGPTGGGDGKTDSETYPVSKSISDRWYINNQNFNGDEKWAFAISSKKEWNSKLKGDVKSIISTNRGYNKIFFVSNQKISSKKKKDIQDLLNEQYNIEVTILDGQWIEDKVLNDKLFDLIVDTLGLSNVYKSKQIIRGSRDNERLEEVNLLEKRITNSSSCVDSQLVEDCLRSAILSRELEEASFSIEGKFLRALNFEKKIDSKLQMLRIYYEYSWTSIFWFNDIDKFKENFKNFISLVDEKSHIDHLELFSNLFTVGKTHFSEEDEINIIKDRLYYLLENKINLTENSTSGLQAKTYLLLNQIMDKTFQQENCDSLFHNLSEVIKKCSSYIGYPFESILESIKVLGELYSDNSYYDDLYDILVDVQEKRTSAISSGRNFLQRAFQKYEANLYGDTIIYLGKSIVKISRNENEFELILVLRLLGNCYRNIGLLWAANNALISALALCIKNWFTKGVIDVKAYFIAIELCKNEILLGRIPQLLSIYELIKVLKIHKEQIGEISEDESPEFFEMAIANRFLNSEYSLDLCKLPDIMNAKEMWFSADAILYLLGYNDLILDQKEYTGRSDEELKNYMTRLANQPISKQFLYSTNYLNDEIISFNAKIIGVNFYLKYQKNKNLLIVSEILLAYLESFLATSLNDLVPLSEYISINIENNSENKIFEIVESFSSKEFTIKINTSIFFDNSQRNILTEEILKFIGLIIEKNFIFKDSEIYIKKLFEKEEVFERTAIVFNHKGFINDIFTTDPKVFLSDWYDVDKFKNYPLKLWQPIVVEKESIVNNDNLDILKNEIHHNKTNVVSIIDSSLWDKAQWNGFGFAAQGEYFIGATLHFNDFSMGKRIFEGWIKEYGASIETKLKLSIIKGVSKKNPYWYRVLITPIFEENNDGVFFLSSRFHDMEPTTPTNMLQVIDAYENLGYLPILPAGVVNDKFEADVESRIKIKNLSIKDAWEISLEDIECVAILEDDDIFIPSNIIDAPILDVIKKKKSKEI
jgi:hypothetical protein